MQWQSIYAGLGDRPLEESSSKNDLSFETANSEAQIPSFSSLSARVFDVSNSNSSFNPRMQGLTAMHDAPSEGIFPTSGSTMEPSFTANDIFRSTSQPAKTRCNFSVEDISMTNNSRDTLYAHKVLKSLRARAPDSGDRQAACDYCRKRKIKASTCYLLN